MAARKDKKKKKQWRLTEMGERSRVEGEESYGREEGGRGGRRERWKEEEGGRRRWTGSWEEGDG